MAMKVCLDEKLKNTQADTNIISPPPTSREEVLSHLCGGLGKMEFRLDSEQNIVKEGLRHQAKKSPSQKHAYHRGATSPQPRICCLPPLPLSLFILHPLRLSPTLSGACLIRIKTDQDSTLLISRSR